MAKRTKHTKNAQVEESEAGPTEQPFDNPETAPEQETALIPTLESVKDEEVAIFQKTASHFVGLALNGMERPFASKEWSALVTARLALSDPCDEVPEIGDDATLGETVDAAIEILKQSYVRRACTLVDLVESASVSGDPMQTHAWKSLANLHKSIVRMSRKRS